MLQEAALAVEPDLPTICGLPLIVKFARAVLPGLTLTLRLSGLNLLLPCFGTTL